MSETPVEKDIVPKALTKTLTKNEIIDTTADGHHRHSGIAMARFATIAATPPARSATARVTTIDTTHQR